jgi:hypothetical protein
LNKKIDCLRSIFALIEEIIAELRQTERKRQEEREREREKSLLTIK